MAENNAPLIEIGVLGNDAIAVQFRPSGDDAIVGVLESDGLYVRRFGK